ncbi:MAG TPA: ABC transporter substrate-binding protein [Gammaproteobacteria bacterium]|nr:ABC transporter substrate-binding protein [Gammaproteobacteria bacterium]
MPEHFNLPWQHLLRSPELHESGVEVEWEDYPAGSGAMRDALDEGRLDLAMLLTEAAAAGIGNGAAFRVVSLYTQTPLIWGIHVPASSASRSVEEIRGARYAISRFGSGSHLMAFVLSEQKAWPADELRFVLVENLDGAIGAFERGAADIFLWEKFMTKPLVDAGRFRRLGELRAPWPAFVVCASERALRDRAGAIAWVLGKVFEAAGRLITDPAAAAEEIAERYGLRSEDAAEWLRATRWAQAVQLDQGALSRASASLQSAGLIPAGPLPQLGFALPLETE